MAAENHQQIFILVIVAFGLTETINNGSDPQKQQILIALPFSNTS